MMKPNKYNALEYCRRTIRSCTTIKQLCNAHNLVLNFRVMFDDVFYNLLLIDEWWDKYKEMCNTKQ